MKALAERLAESLDQAVFASAQPLQFAALKTVTPAPEELEGLTVASITTRGKFVVMDFAGPRLAFHLSQGGRVDIEAPPRISRPKMGVVRLRFKDAPAILIKEFGTERKAGWWVLAAGDEGPMATLGPEPGTDAFNELIRTSQDNRRLHTMLRDQHTVAGMGRGYTDDALHDARLSPYASLKSLDAASRETLLNSIDKVLADGLEAERKRRGGLPTKLGDHWVVHNRAGEPCPECGADLRRVSYESHEVTYCPDCQTGGRVLADRRMSRLVK